MCWTCKSENSNPKRCWDIFFFLFKWFGNLVTMNWWNDLWLNEGLTSYFEYLGATFVEPELSLVSANAYWIIESFLWEETLKGIKSNRNLNLALIPQTTNRSPQSSINFMTVHFRTWRRFSDLLSETWHMVLWLYSRRWQNLPMREGNLDVSVVSVHRAGNSDSAFSVFFVIAIILEERKDNI